MKLFSLLILLLPTLALADISFNPALHQEGQSTSGVDVPAALVGKTSDTGNFTYLKTDELGQLVTTALTGFGADFAFGDIKTSAIALTKVERTTYTMQTTNAQRSFASSSANDSSAGTGARTIRLTYLDASGNGPYEEIITLNGTSYVNTTNTNICFIDHIEVVTVGSTGSNVGIITMKAASAGGGATIGTIAATDNRTFWAHHYVPVGKTANITGIAVSHNGTTVGSGGVFIVRAKKLDNAAAADVQVTDFIRLYGQASTFSRTYTSPVKVTGPAQLTTFVTPETSSSTVYRASIDFFIP